MDYVLRVKTQPETQAVAVALIEAKKERRSPGYGLSQAKGYAARARLNVPFVFFSNGHMFVEFDRSTGLTSQPQPMEAFPSPAVLRQRYEKALGIDLGSDVARPLVTPYPGGEGTRRYYQDAAIRAVMEKVARCELAGEPKRALLSLGFTYKHEDWVRAFPEETAAAIQALAGQFAKGGADSLENPRVFQTPEVKAAGGLAALRAGGKPADILRETKNRMFAA